jgi:hypothetical protein
MGSVTPLGLKDDNVSRGEFMIIYKSVHGKNSKVERV